MRVPRVRFTMRRLMVGVAVIGIAFGAAIDSVKQGNFRGRASTHSLKGWDFPGFTYAGPGIWKQLCRSYHLAMAELMHRTADLLGEPLREDVNFGRCPACDNLIIIHGPPGTG